MEKRLAAYASERRLALSKKRLGYEQAKAAITADELFSVLTDITRTAMEFRADSQPHVACFVVGRIQEQLRGLRGHARTIMEFEKLQRELEELDHKRMMDNGRG